MPSELGNVSQYINNRYINSYCHRGTKNPDNKAHPFSSINPASKNTGNALFLRTINKRQEVGMRQYIVASNYIARIGNVRQISVVHISTVSLHTLCVFSLHRVLSLCTSLR